MDLKTASLVLVALALCWNLSRLIRVGRKQRTIEIKQRAIEKENASLRKQLDGLGRVMDRAMMEGRHVSHTEDTHGR